MVRSLADRTFQLRHVLGPEDALLDEVVENLLEESRGRGYPSRDLPEALLRALLEALHSGKEVA